jgi:predicted aconitase
VKIALLFALTILQQIAAAQNVSQQKPEDATQAITRLFDRHDVVMFGEIHSNKQEYEWLCSLLKTPEFSANLDDVVVEFGNALYQQDVDRYVAGEDVPFGQIQNAWRNMIVSVTPVSPNIRMVLPSGP